MISVRDQPESQYMSGCSSRTTVFLAKRASTSDADGPKAFQYQVSASESYWSSQETSATTFLTLLSIRPCTPGPVVLEPAARRAGRAPGCGERPRGPESIFSLPLPHSVLPSNAHVRQFGNDARRRDSSMEDYQVPASWLYYLVPVAYLSLGTIILSIVLR